MSTVESFRALRRANPRARDDFARVVEAAAATVHADIDAMPERVEAPRGRRRLAAASAAAVLGAIAVGATILAVGSPKGVEDATAALKSATAVTAASAERSGTAVVRMTHNGEVWAARTIRWNGSDLALADGGPGRRGRAGGELRVVNGMMYGIENGGWVSLGSPASIDPGSGTTPAEYLAAVREDVGGPTLARITDGMAEPKVRRVDGSTVYSGTVAAGLIARETGFKEGQAIRVLPFGYVAHDEAADPTAQLDTAVTVGADGVVRQLAVTWGSWTYTVTYRALGETAAPAAPANARPLREQLRTGVSRATPPTKNP